ncbi:uncharacterized protein [Watersipora subatra]|uniref:uncharacterized protein n=1 Tax=Watersipora subatra TaxID=2589382 RepID=UPI00355AEBC4
MQFTADTKFIDELRMIENASRDTSSPPDYNDVVNSSVYIIELPGATHNVVPPPPPIFELPQQHRADIPVHSPTNNSRGELWHPPSYDEILGIRALEVVAASQATTDADSATTISSVGSTSAESARTQSQSCSHFQSECHEKVIRLVVLIRSAIGCVALTTVEVIRLVVLICSAVGCVALTTVATVFGSNCPANGFLPSIMKSSGWGGFLYTALVGLFYYCRHRGNESHKHKPLLFGIFPFILIILYFLGCSSAYSLWLRRPCNPGTPGDTCSGFYCDDFLLLFSVVFYSSTLVLLSPLWLLILYVLFKPIGLHLTKLLCPNWKGCTPEYVRQCPTTLF